MSTNEPVSPAQMSQYLALRGWSRNEEASDDAVDVFEHREIRDASREPIALFVPRDEALADFALMRDNLIRALADLEGRSAGAVLSDMAAGGVDVFSARILVPGDEHRLMLKSLLDALRALFDLFTAAASSEVRKPAPYFTEPPREARRFAAELFVPALAPGSVVLQIECPVDGRAAYATRSISSADPLDVEEPPLGRRVMLRVIRGLKDAPLLGPPGREELFGRGLNANMCDALTSFHEGIRAFPVEFAARWEPRLRAPEDLKDMRPIRYQPRDFEIVREISRALRQPRGPRPMRLEGHVLELKARRVALDTTGEQVALLSAEVDGRTQPVRIALEEDDYRTACRAHLERRPVVAEGVLERVGKRWQITRYTRFGLV